MSYVLKCDKCGRIIDKLESYRRIVVQEVSKKYKHLPKDEEIEVSKELGTYDLCRECQFKFNNWLWLDMG